jgi:hypothetical protein
VSEHAGSAEHQDHHATPLELLAIVLVTAQEP